MGLATIMAAASVVIVILMLGQAVYWAYRSFLDSRNEEVSRRLGTIAANEKENLLRFQSAEDRARQEGTIDLMMRRAGSPYPLNSLYAAISGASVVGLVVGFIAFKSAAGLIGLSAGLIPILILRYQAEGRMEKLVSQLPDALDLLSRSLQAGHGIGEAMRMAAEEVPEPLGLEFARIYEENNLGRDLRECLQNLVKRNPGSFDMQIFVSSVLLQRDTGGNLVEILQNISATVRARFLFQGKLAALTSEAKFTGWVLGSLPFFVTLMITWRNPTYLSPLWTDPMGIAMLMLCILMFSVGVFLMSDFSKVEV